MNIMKSIAQILKFKFFNFDFFFTFVAYYYKKNSAYFEFSIKLNHAAPSCVRSKPRFLFHFKVFEMTATKYLQIKSFGDIFFSKIKSKHDLHSLNQFSVCILPLWTLSLCFSFTLPNLLNRHRIVRFQYRSLKETTDRPLSRFYFPRKNMYDESLKISLYKRITNYWISKCAVY